MKLFIRNSKIHSLVIMRVNVTNGINMQSKDSSRAAGEKPLKIL